MIGFDGPLEGHPYHDKTDAELLYIARGAYKVANAFRGHPFGHATECKYLDQVNDACTVMHYRKTRGQVR